MIPGARIELVACFYAVVAFVILARFLEVTA